MKQRSLRALLFAVTLCVTLLGFAGTSHAVGTYRFCAAWQYQFSDQGLGEDYFTYTGATGAYPAAYTWAIVQLNNQNTWAGYLDPSGCSAAVPALAGSYKLYITAQIRTPNGAFVTATPQDGVTRWFTATRQLPGSNSNISYHSNMGGGDTTGSAISLATWMAQAQDARFVPGVNYRLFTELGGYEAHYSGGAIFLGTDEYLATWVTRLKTVVAHELGHAIQDRLFGFQSRSLGQNSAVELCQCNHIDFPAIQSHCLQSREAIGAAQSEGFGHFTAAQMFNRHSDADAWFAYYKEVRWQNGGPDSYPPQTVTAFYPSATWHWMEWRGCAAANSGTEIDWMNFYYEIHAKTANRYSYYDIARVFKDACGGGTCTSANVTTWASLQNSVNARFGAASAKALYFAQMGDWHGVNW